MCAGRRLAPAKDRMHDVDLKQKVWRNLQTSLTSKDKLPHACTQSDFLLKEAVVLAFWSLGLILTLNLFWQMSEHKKTEKNYQEAESYICVKHNILRKNSPHPHSNKDKGAYKWHGIKYLEYIRSKVLVTKVETDSTFLSAGRIQISISNSVTSSSGDRDVTVTTTLHVIWCKTWQVFFLVASTRKSSVRKTHA